MPADVLPEDEKLKKDKITDAKNQYDRYKTLSEGLLDITALTANASQLNAVISNGPDSKYYVLLLVLLSVCIFLQIIVGLLLLLLGATQYKKNPERYHYRMTQSVLAFIMIIIILNIFIAAFGIKYAE